MLYFYVEIANAPVPWLYQSEKLTRAEADTLADLLTEWLGDYPYVQYYDSEEL